jgi:hypothetical protein
MSEIEGYRRRVTALRKQVAALPRVGWGEKGPVDEQTGERWDRGNVLGHVAEMVPFWTIQVRRVLDGVTEMGRDEQGSVQRRLGIDAGRDAGEEELLRRIDQGLEGLQALLADMTDADLDRRLTYRGHAAPRDVNLRYGLGQLLVGHVEEHLAQLAELSS